jgi:hypothetical protein
VQKLNTDSAQQCSVYLRVRDAKYLSTLPQRTNAKV